jgi:hypothetical protein
MTGFTRIALAWLIYFATLLALASPAAAHLTPNSEIGLTIGAKDVRADIIIPQSEYMVATSYSAGNDPQSLSRAKAYIENRFKVFTPQGTPWSVQVDVVEFAQRAGPPDLHAVAVLIPPSGASPRNFVAEWHAVVDELPSHFALFVIRRDIAGVSGAEPQIAGAVRSGAARIVINVGGASQWREFRNTVRLGIDHIIGGYDHLMFLLALLLPAPLAASAGRWATVRDWRSTVRSIVGTVTAFTIGHSLSLIGATLGGWQLPVQPVEIAIAMSVLVSTAHAVRPLFPGYEPLVAGGFGLIHGLAFATLIADLHLGSTVAPIALLGFNLGIEAVQLVIVLAALPALILLARDQFYHPLRTGLAVVGMAAAVAWLLNRAFGIGDGIIVLAEQAIAAIAVVLATASVVFVASHLLRHRLLRRPSARQGN